MRALLGLWLCLLSASGQQLRWQDPHLRAADDYIRWNQLPKAVEVLETVIDVEPNSVVLCPTTDQRGVRSTPGRAGAAGAVQDST